MKIEVIVFDLYNTLIEIKKKRQVFRLVYGNCNLQKVISFSDYINLMLTKDLEEIKNILPPNFESEIEKQAPEIEKEIESVEIFPETNNVLKSLTKDYQLFLISNLASIYKKPFFDLQLSNWFEKALFSCDLGIRKPNKLIFREVEKLSGKTGNQILMIGDSLRSDIEGAKQLNWNTLLINRTSNPINQEQISSLYEIEEKLKQA